jgi:hypothetical protein
MDYGGEIVSPSMIITNVLIVPSVPELPENKSVHQLVAALKLHLVFSLRLKSHPYFDVSCNKLVSVK